MGARHVNLKKVVLRDIEHDVCKIWGKSGAQGSLSPDPDFFTTALHKHQTTSSNPFTSPKLWPTPLVRSLHFSLFFCFFIIICLLSNIILSAYIDVGGYNVITVDWSRESQTLLYPIAAAWTKPIGEEIAKLLENIVQVNVIKPSDIHVIGHSLGAHVAGVCGYAFQLGKIGRITGEQIVA